MHIDIDIDRYVTICHFPEFYWINVNTLKFPQFELFLKIDSRLPRRHRVEMNHNSIKKEMGNSYVLL